MKSISILSLILFFVSFVIAHDTCVSVLANNPETFTDGSQHADCDYEVPSQTPANASEHEWDLYWINLAHQYAIVNSPSLPWGACLVDSRNNTLVSIGSNMFYSDHPIFSHQVVSHAETVVITNATIHSLPDSWDPVTKRRKPHPDWKHLVLYGNIEACPMCAQGAIWRGLRKMVFGARASALQQQRCWSQSKTTAYEIADQSSHFASFSVVRGPMPELENTIVQAFSQSCKTPTQAPTQPPTPTPTTTATTTTFTCTADFHIFTQPPSWPNGLNAALSVSVSDSSKLMISEDEPGWEITFSTTGFRIDNSWGVGRITSSIVNDIFTYTIPNTNYNAQNPTNIGFTAYTTVSAPFNNICALSINGVACDFTPESDASVIC